MDIKELLALKHTLRFNENGKFRILMMSDLHGGVGFNPQLTDAIEATVAHANPDLVLINGDTSGCDSKVHCETQEQLRDLLKKLSEPMESRHIPWAHTFGNHDDNFGLATSDQEPVYEEFEYCVSKYGDKDISGVANYVLPILAHDSDKIKFNVWGLDSHDNMKRFAEEYNLPEDTQFVLCNHSYMGRHFDTAHFDQAMWYYGASRELEKYNGEKIPAIMYMHIPLPEYSLIVNNRNWVNYEGDQDENVASSELNNGLFAACLERGDVKAIFAGHEHVNNFTGYYCGIMLGYDGGLDYDCYQSDKRRGARIIDIDENNPWRINTHMVFIRDLLGEKGNKKLK